MTVFALHYDLRQWIIVYTKVQNMLFFIWISGLTGIANVRIVIVVATKEIHFLIVGT